MKKIVMSLVLSLMLLIGVSKSVLASEASNTIQGANEPVTSRNAVLDDQTFNTSNILSVFIVGNDTLVTLSDGTKIILGDYQGHLGEFAVAVDLKENSRLRASHGFANSITATTTIYNYSSHGPATQTVSRKTRRVYNGAVAEALYRGSIRLTSSIKQSGGTTQYAHSFKGSIPYISSKMV